MLQYRTDRIVLDSEYKNQFQSLVEIMSAKVCNVFEVVLRTPGDRIHATIKISRIVFTLSRDLSVINQNVMKSKEHRFLQSHQKFRQVFSHSNHK
jgi:ABC-type enterochelin transport system permease subunit